MLPLAQLATVKAIEMASEPVKHALAGDSVDVGLQGVDPAVLMQVNMLNMSRQCLVSSRVSLFASFTCSLLVSQAVPDKHHVFDAKLSLVYLN